MLNLNTFKNRMIYTSGTSIRDENIKNSKQFLNSTFFDDASFNPNIKLWNTDSQLKCRITDRKKSSTYGVTCKIQMLISDTLDIGDIIFDTVENVYWICLEMHIISEVVKQGLIGLCNYIFKFQHKKTGDILSYPCIDSTNNTAGIDEDKVITTGNAIRTIKLPFDANTVLIDIDDRFIIDDPSVDKPQVFAVSKPNRTEYKHGDKGLIELTMKQGVYNPKTDRKDLVVCNYIEPGITPLPPEKDNYSTITSSNTNNQIIIGSMSGRTLTPKFYKDNIEVYNIDAVWVCEFPAGYENQFTTSRVVGTNKLKIIVKDNTSLIGKVVIASVSDELGDYKSSIPLTITSGFY